MGRMLASELRQGWGAARGETTERARLTVVSPVGEAHLRFSMAEYFSPKLGFDEILMAMAKRHKLYFENLLGQTRRELFRNSGANLERRVAFCRALEQAGLKFVPSPR